MLYDLPLVARWAADWDIDDGDVKIQRRFPSSVETKDLRNFLRTERKDKNRTNFIFIG